MLFKVNNRNNLVFALFFRRALPIDRARHREKGQPLCMEQYYRLFSSYREPGVNKDRLTTTAAQPGSEHITVIRHNQVHASVELFMNVKSANFDL